MKCEFKEGRCIHCGWEKPAGMDRVVRECDTWRAGDDLENWLISYGITRERWIAAKQALGLPPRCNCNARKEWLNQASAKLQVVADKLKNLLDDYYSKPR